jgi:predicted nucleotidyltransferase
MALLFETLTGSKAYGLGLPNSDTDVLRVLAHSKRNYFGLEEYTEAKHVIGPKNVDAVEYDLRFFAKMLIKGSFNALLPLHFKQENHKYVSKSFEPFLRMNYLFFTREAAASFYGFSYKMFKEFKEREDFKSAANGLFVLNAAVELSKLGCVTFETSGFLLDVKRGYVARETLTSLYNDELNYYTPERLSEGRYTNNVDYVRKILSGLCVKILGELE